MAAHEGFLNDFIDNSHRHDAYVSDVQERQSGLIDLLGEKVASNRGTSFTPAVRVAIDDRVTNGGMQAAVANPE